MPSSSTCTVLLLATALALGCQGSGPDVLGPGIPAADRPPARLEGPRLPAYSGADPATLAWEEVGWEGAGGVWLQRGAPHRLRTAHVSICSSAPEAASLEVARRAEAHVVALFCRYGEALDLRLPLAPLRIEVHASRAAFQGALARVCAAHPRWGAFYDWLHATVHVCVEPAPEGALPLVADVRHEVTHQVLELSTPGRQLARVWRGENLWLWEGFAAYSEALGDAPGEDTGRARRDRFARRRAREEVTPLSILFHLDQASFKGRQYDQAAVLVAFFMGDGVPGARQALLDTLADVLRARGSPNGFERKVGRDAHALEAAWKATW